MTQAVQVRQAYRSRMTNWDTRSSVRAQAKRKFEPSSAALMFSPELIPLLVHDLVQSRGDTAARTIMIQKLLSYLEFTEHLERKLIIRACISLAHNETPLMLPDALQWDASRIIVDEAHHAECANALVLEIVNSTDWVRQDRREPAVVKFLEKEVAELDNRRATLAKLAFTSASETLITGTLTQVPKDLRVHPVVRQVITDHARDEATHHACFSDFVGIMWDQLDDDDRDFVGPMLARSIIAFLEPDRTSEQNWLLAACFTPDEARRIVNETHEAIGAGPMREAARPSIAVLERHGVLDCQATIDVLGARGLI